MGGSPMLCFQLLLSSCRGSGSSRTRGSSRFPARSGAGAGSSLRLFPVPGTLSHAGFPKAFCSGSPLQSFSRTSAHPRSDCANEMVEELSATPLPMLPLQAAAYTCVVITEGDGGCWHLLPM